MPIPLLSQLEANALLAAYQKQVAMLKQENEELQRKLSLLADDYLRASNESRQRFELVLTVLGGK